MNKTRPEIIVGDNETSDGHLHHVEITIPPDFEATADGSFGLRMKDILRRSAGPFLTADLDPEPTDESSIVPEAGYLIWQLKVPVAAVDLIHRAIFKAMKTKALPVNP